MVEKINLKEREYNEMIEYIYNNTGIYLDIKKKDSVELKITNRMRVNNITTFNEYFNILKNDPEQNEFKELVDLLTVNETYFFRNLPQLNTFRDKIIPLLLENNRNIKNIRIWSAGISIGCEPYTLAIILKESIPDIFNWNIYILGNDISHSALKVAKSGLYTEREIKDVPPYLLMKYFKKAGKYYKINDEIINMIDIQEFNIFDFDRIDRLPQFDVIFCRNLLIYFDDKSRRKVVDKFYEKLKRPGYIFLGHSESLNRISKAFTLKRIGNDLVYVKE